MKRNWRKVTILLIVLSLVMVIVVPASAGTAIDTEALCSLTVEPGAFEDLIGVEIAVDIYRVADVSAYCKYTPVAGFESLDLSAKEEGDEKWQSEADKAVALILAEDSEIEPTATALIEDTKVKLEELATGVYMVIAHAPEAEKADYVVRDEETGKTYTKLDTDLFTYTILPSMVSLPASEDGKTSSDNWLYDYKISLKMEQENRFGDVLIIKQLDTYSTLQGITTFVFDVRAEYKGELIYSNVEAMIFDAPGQQYKLIEHLPAGTVVTVTEVYSGACYTLVSNPTETATVIANGLDGSPVSVFFENDYDDDVPGGHGAINKFTYDGEKWVWEQEDGPTQNP